MFTLSGLLATFRQGSVRRSAIRTLNGLSPAQLSDLGLTHDGIDAVVGDMLVANESRRTRAADHPRSGGFPAMARTAPAGCG